MSLLNCGCNTTCNCDQTTVYQRALPKHKHVFTTSQQRALDLVEALLSQTGCKASITPKQLLELFQLECELEKGRYPVVILALRVAARLVDMRAIVAAETGNIRTLSFAYAGSTAGNAMSGIAAKWRTDADRAIDECLPAMRVTRGATLNKGALKLSLYAYYLHSNCIDADYAITSCNYGCDEC